jgi:hypothetical protein
MKATHVIVPLALTLASAAASADNESAAVRLAPIAIHAPAVEAMLHPGTGRVPFTIRTTQPRRVMVRDVATGSLEYACTTPCRLYVAPGPLAVSLEGWTSHQYQWDVPARGGSVSLLSRSPAGDLDPLPTDETFARASLHASN